MDCGEDLRLIAFRDGRVVQYAMLYVLRNSDWIVRGLADSCKTRTVRVRERLTGPRKTPIGSMPPLGRPARLWNSHRPNVNLLPLRLSNWRIVRNKCAFVYM